MSKEHNIFKQQLDEQNRQIILHKIERNRIIEEQGENLDMMLPEYQLDYNANIIRVNQKLAELLEYSSVEELLAAIKEGEYSFLKSDLISLFAKDNYVIDRPLFIRAKNGNLLSLQESMIKCKSGNQLYYTGLINFRESSGQARQSGIVERNIIKQLYDNFKDAVLVCDSNYKVWYANSAMRRMLKDDESDNITVRHLFDFVPHETEEKLKATIAELYRTGNATQSEHYVAMASDGTLIDLQAYFSLYDKGDEKHVIIVVPKSIDEEQKRKENNHMLYGQTINSLSELYILLKPNCDICDINEAAMRLWGWDYDVYLTKSIFDLGAFSVGDLRSLFASLINDMKPIEMDFAAVNTIWGNVTLKAKCVPISGEEQKFISLIIENNIAERQIKEVLNNEYKNNMALFDNSLCGIIQLQNNKIVKANNTVYSALKINRDLRGENFSDIFKETKRKKRRIVTAASNRKEEVFVYEIVVNRKHILFEVHVFDVDKTYTYCYFMDITPRKNVTLLQENAASRYKAIVEQSPCGVLIGDSHGDIIDVSERFCEMIKLPPSEILGRNIMSLFSEKSVTSRPFDYQRVDVGCIVSAERDLQCGDGTVKVVEMYSCALAGDMYQAVVLDITQRKIYENQMIDFRKRADRLVMQKEHFLKMASGVTIVFGKDSEVKDIFIGKNAPLCKLTKTEEEATNVILQFISSKEYDLLIRQCVARIHQEYIDGNNNDVYSVQREILLFGRRYYLEASFSAMEDDVVMAISDVTAREMVMNNMREALQKSEDSKNLQSAMLGNLSHELRTPLNGIIGFADLLLEIEEDEEKRDYLQTILNSSNQLLSVLTDIIEMSKLDAGVVNVKLEFVSLNNLFATIYDVLHSIQLAKSNNVELVNLSVGKEDVSIATDVVKLRQILTNLITNAMKFAKDGRVELDYAVKGDKVCISVRDNGIGIAEEDLQKIFDRFFQTKQGKEVVAKGSGVGLSIVKSYVEMLGGSVWVESELGKGSCFFVELPK